MRATAKNVLEEVKAWADMVKICRKQPRRVTSPARTSREKRREQPMSEAREFPRASYSLTVPVGKGQVPWANHTRAQDDPNAEEQGLAFRGAGGGLGLDIARGIREARGEVEVLAG